jgi:hypothetical protein
VEHEPERTASGQSRRERVRDVRRRLYAGTIDQATGCPRLQALRLPDPPFEPDFDRFQPF